MNTDSLIEKLYELKLKMPCGLTRHAAISDCIDIVREHMGDASTRKDEGYASLPIGISLISPANPITMPPPGMQFMTSSTVHPREISDVARLIDEIDHSLDYFQVEFPALANEKNRQIWADPISYHCGGISPDDLMSIKNILASIRKPVIVDLEKCARAAAGTYYDDHGAIHFTTREIYCDRSWNDFIKDAKAVLDAAGVKYEN